MKMEALIRKNLKLITIILAVALIVVSTVAAHSVLRAEDEEIPFAEAPAEVYEPAVEEIVIDEPAPEPEPEPEPVPEFIPEPAPVVIPEPVPEIIPEPAPAPAPEPQPQPEPQPAPEPEPEVIEEPEDLEEPEEPAVKTVPAQRRSVSARYEVVSEGPIGPGTVIRLIAAISGFEGETPVYQWQYSADGHTWHDMPGANGATYTYSLNDDNYAYDWRVIVDA